MQQSEKGKVVQAWSLWVLSVSGSLLLDTGVGANFCPKEQKISHYKVGTVISELGAQHEGWRHPETPPPRDSCHGFCRSSSRLCPPAQLVSVTAFCFHLL